MKQTWRQYYAPVIAEIIANNSDKDIKEIKKILRDSNPGQYGHMKKIWANEYMRQLGLSKKRSDYNKNQTDLFKND